MAAAKTTTLEIKTHDGLTTQTVVENYDAAATLEDLRGEGNSLVAIGDVILHRSNIARVVPVQEK